MSQSFDVAVIGGGINGCGIAADAAMRGLSVVLIEKDDLASKTSSSSTKLIHGGLRYLEFYNFSMVRKSLTERQILLDMAPHLVFPRPFVIPSQPSSRPDWVVRIGLFLYDHLSRNNKLPGSKRVRRENHASLFSPLTAQNKKGFLYYDGCTDDARLTLSNALQARQHGAVIHTNSELIKTAIKDGKWQLLYRDKSGATASIQSRTLVNATGPWIDAVNQTMGVPGHHQLSLVKGSHIVVPRLYKGEQAYLLQHEDKRVVFVVPYHGYSMIGTTDILFDGAPEDVAISSDETNYLLTLVSRYFKQTITSDDIVNTWSGIRPLIAGNSDKPQAISRDYVYEYSNAPAPSLTIYGGKITTYRQLARDVINELREVFPGLPDSRTDVTPLPGARLGTMNWQEYCNHAYIQYTWADDSLLQRWLHSYGTRTEIMLIDCHSMYDMGRDFGQGLFQREVDFLLNEEWASNADDILWRRSKLGLGFSKEKQQVLEAYCMSHSLETAARM